MGVGDDAVDFHFSVLGPVRAWRAGELLPLGTPQQRALFTALLLRDGRTATSHELIDAIWDDEPPRQALAVTRTYASRLRKVLSEEIVVGEAGGYAVRMERGVLDLSVARELALAAEKVRAAGDLAQARWLLNKSLEMWDGEPLAGVPGPYAQAQRGRLEEWRLQLLENRIQLDLEMGAHADAVSELTALTTAHPLREQLRGLLMLALYRGGRQAEALAVYADTRRLLAEELGVDPNPELEHLQVRILRADRALGHSGEGDPSPLGASAMLSQLPPPTVTFFEALPTPAQLPSPTVSFFETLPRPAQLPAPAVPFVGRASSIRELADWCTGAGAPVGAVAALSGFGGVGKTALAVHTAHEMRQHFPDGQLFADLHGVGHSPAAPGTVLASFLRALGTPDALIPESVEDRTALYRSILSVRRVLVVLDGARDAAQVRPLLPGSVGSVALVTSRARMVGLDNAHLVDLDVMSVQEALQLFTSVVGQERGTVEREAALDVVAACGFLPLAIRIAASRLVARRTWTVSALADRLADERRRLDELQAGDIAVKATFELSYALLRPDQARAFRLTSLVRGPEIPLAAAAAALALSPQQAEDLMESLVDVSLLESPSPAHYRYPDLVRLHARSCAERDETPEEVEAALSRLSGSSFSAGAGAAAADAASAVGGHHGRFDQRGEDAERLGLQGGVQKAGRSSGLT